MLKADDVTVARTGRVLLALGTLLCLCFIWLPQYFLTGDGPCHVANARIVHDIWAGNEHAVFWKQFIRIDYAPNPNWFTTACVALLMYVMDGVTAEKVFLSLYVLFFLRGYYLLMRQTGCPAPLWYLAVLPFVFTSVLFKGFYNFSFSMVFLIWGLYAWLSFLHYKKGHYVALFVLFVVLCFFTHLLSFVYVFIICGALVISFAATDAKNNWWRYFIRHEALLILVALPFLLPIRWFTDKEGGLALQLGFHGWRLVKLLQMEHMVCLKSKEYAWTTACGAVIALLMLGAIATIVRKRSWHRLDGFVLAFVIIALIYLLFPDDMFGRAMEMALRTQAVVSILLVLVISYRAGNGRVLNAAGVVLFLCFAALMARRGRCMFKASAAESELMSVLPYIAPHSVVLPLDFSPSGTDDYGDAIADRIWLYSHAGQYIGVKKPVMVLDNYEANMGYFPTIWQARVNPYWALSKEEGIEATPPYAEIMKYTRNTGVSIGYIVLWGYQQVFLDNAHFRKLWIEINENYHVVYRSVHGRAILYERNRG